MLAYGKKMFAAALTLAGLALFATADARAQGFRHGHHGHRDHCDFVDYHRIDHLAVQMQRDFRTLHRVVDRLPPGVPQARHLHEDVEQMENLARHIHEVAHHRGSLAHLRADVKKLDGLFHHVEHLLDEMGHGVYNRQAFLIRISMRRASRTLHQLQHDLR